MSRTPVVGDRCVILFAVQLEHKAGAVCEITGPIENIDTLTHGVVSAFPITVDGERWYALPEQLRLTNAVLR